MRNCAWLVGLTMLLLAGCSSARLVESTPTGGCVAVADNSDGFPHYNMTHAKELMSQDSPKGYTILKQEEFVTGQETTNSTSANSAEFNLISWIFRDVGQSSKTTTDTHNTTEWRIWYQKN